MTGLIRTFLNRGGAGVVISSFIYKVILLLYPLILVRVVSIKEYGEFELARSLVLVLSPFFCLGMHEALLKFAAVKINTEVNYILKKIFVPAMFSCFILAGFAFLSTLVLPSSFSVPGKIAPFSIYIITWGGFLLISNYFRAKHENAYFSLYTLLSSIFILLLFFIFYKAEINDFEVYALVFSPVGATLTLLMVLLYKGYDFTVKRSSFSLKAYAVYGTYIGVGGIVSQLALVLDVIMLGWYLSDTELVGFYKLSTIIPSLFIFIATIYFKSEFGSIVKMDSACIVRYYMQYVTHFIVLASVFFGIAIFFYEDIYKTLFNAELDVKFYYVFLILVFTALVSVLVRVPLGNILNARGYASFNVKNAILALILNILMNYFFIAQYGVVGAAIGTAVSIFITGGLQLIKFRGITNGKR